MTHLPKFRFQSHLDAAQKFWKEIIYPGDIVIDATCGNGHDTLLLAKLLLTPNSGTLYALDKQKKAVDFTKERLFKELEEALFDKVHFINQCHSNFPVDILPQSVKLIVYNLGYLPGGGNKEFTTETHTTLKSLEAAMQLLSKGGAISLMCYPGHEEGEREESAILEFVKNLDSKVWQCCYQQWINRFKSPSFLTILKN